MGNVKNWSKNKKIGVFCIIAFAFVAFIVILYATGGQTSATPRVDLQVDANTTQTNDTQKNTDENTQKVQKTKIEKSLSSIEATIKTLSAPPALTPSAYTSALSSLASLGVTIDNADDVKTPYYLFAQGDEDPETVIVSSLRDETSELVDTNTWEITVDVLRGQTAVVGDGTISEFANNAATVMQASPDDPNYQRTLTWKLVQSDDGNTATLTLENPTWWK